MKTINFVLQGKGGIGKTTISVMIAQLLKQQDAKALFLDLDQENPTFSGFKALNVKSISVMNNDRVIDPRKFDDVMMQIFESKSDVLVDTGANTFSPLLAYFVENGIFDLLNEQKDTRTVIHSIIGGGDVMRDTLTGFHNLCQNFPTIPKILWKNEHFGEMIIEGKKLEETKPYLSAQSQIIGEVLLPKRSAATFGQDMTLLQSARLTLDEASSDDRFNFLSRNRLKTIYTSAWVQINQALSHAAA
jgi:energy-coupling factor transporter ATP-binding protein EcfA2